jgi:YVTN family beta-propeller protein
MKIKMIFPVLMLLLILFTASVVVISGCGSGATSGGGGGGGSAGVFSGKVYVSDYSNKRVIVISGEAGNISTIELTGATNPKWMAINPSGTKLYVADDFAHVQTSEVFVINTATDTVEAIVWVCQTARGMVFNSDGSKLFVNSNNAQSICIITTATNSFTDYPGVDRISGTGSDINGIAYNPAKNWLYVCSTGSDRIDVATADASTTNTFTSIPVDEPYDVAMNISNESIYVTTGYTKYGGGFLVSYEADTLDLKASIESNAPNGDKYLRNVAVSPDGKHVYAGVHDYSYIDSLNSDLGTMEGINVFATSPSNLNNLNQIAFSSDSKAAFVVDNQNDELVGINVETGARAFSVSLPSGDYFGIAYKP